MFHLNLKCPSCNLPKVWNLNPSRYLTQAVYRTVQSFSLNLTTQPALKCSKQQVLSRTKEPTLSSFRVLVLRRTWDSVPCITMVLVLFNNSCMAAVLNSSCFIGVVLRCTIELVLSYTIDPALSLTLDPALSCPMEKAFSRTMEAALSCTIETVICNTKASVHQSSCFMGPLLSSTMESAPSRS